MSNFLSNSSLCSMCGGEGSASKMFDGADYFSATYPTALQDVWVFKVGGASGPTVATVTLNYSDAERTDPSEGIIT